MVFGFQPKEENIKFKVVGIAVTAVCHSCTIAAVLTQLDDVSCMMSSAKENIQHFISGFWLKMVRYLL